LVIFSGSGKDSTKAQKHFNEAIKVDSSIIFTSDIYKLLGQTYSDKDSVAYYDSLYVNKSSQLVPLGFLHSKNFPVDSLLLGLKGSEYINNHFLKSYTTVPYLLRPNYGVISHTPIPYAIHLGILYLYGGLAYIGEFSHKFSDNSVYSIQYINSTFTDGFNVILQHQLFQDKYNRKNYTIGTSINFHKFDISSNKEVNYFDISIISQFSFYLSQKIQFHNFWQVFYFNELNPIIKPDYELWRNSTFNLGLTGYLYRHFGAQTQLLFTSKGLKPHISPDMSVGFCLYDLEIGYRIMSKTVFIHAVSIPFFMNKFTILSK
jgi:hypothetical protein